MHQGTISPHEARILVAEDMPMNQLVMRKMLQRLGIGTIEIVNNGTLALQRHRDTRWDIVLMDCHMPEMNGYDATVAIRAYELGKGNHIPIIAITADAMVGDREMCLRSGMDDYISKPINLDQLRETLSQWIAFPQFQ